MTYEQAREIARGNLNAFRMADYRHLAGQGKKPDPRFYGVSGHPDQPGNSMVIEGYLFHVDEVCPPTQPVHAGF